MQPEVGKRYRISRELTVKKILNPSVRNGIKVVDEEGVGFRVHPYSWKEIEPEYKEGALYLDSDGVLWIRTVSAFRKTGTLDTYGTPKHPVQRLYREGEVQSG